MQLLTPCFFYSSMEVITVSELPDSVLHIDVNIELFMSSQGAGDLFVRLTEIVIKWQPKDKP